MARNGGRAAAVAVKHDRTPKAMARPSHPATAAPLGAVVQPEPATPAVAAKPQFHERSLLAEGHAVAFRIDAGGGWATGSLPWGAGENEIARFLSEAIGLAKQMQAAMGDADAATVQILVADMEAGTSRQSAIQVSLATAGGTAVTLQPGGSGHLVAMLQHFLMALNGPQTAA